MCVILLGMDYFSPDAREEWKAAFRASRDVAPGKNRDEVRALYLAELRSRDISPPPDDYLEMDVTRVINASQPKEAAFRAARDVAPGKKRGEVRAVYLAELRSRDISPPPPDDLRRDVTRIINASQHKAAAGHAARRRRPARLGLLTRLLISVRLIRNAKRFRELLR
jgi:hypothetical protein